MPKKLILIAVPFILFSACFLGAQEQPPEDNPFVPQTRTNQRSLGDQAFAITAGLYIPLFTVLLEDWPAGPSAGAYPTNLLLGGTGSLAYSFYLSPNWKLGLQLAGSFSEEINGNFAYTIPITVKGSYEFHPWGRVSIPVFLGAGIAMTSWKDDNFSVDMILRPGVGVYFDWNYEWSFGLDISYWFIPQIGQTNSWENSIGNFMDVTLTAEYHF